MAAPGSPLGRSDLLELIAGQDVTGSLAALVQRAQRRWLSTGVLVATNTLIPVNISAPTPGNGQVGLCASFGVMLSVERIVNLNFIVDGAALDSEVRSVSGEKKPEGDMWLPFQSSCQISLINASAAYAVFVQSFGIFYYMPRSLYDKMAGLIAEAFHTVEG